MLGIDKQIMKMVTISQLIETRLKNQQFTDLILFFKYDKKRQTILFCKFSKKSTLHIQIVFH